MTSRSSKQRVLSAHLSLRGVMLSSVGPVSRHDATGIEEARRLAQCPRAFSDSSSTEIPAIAQQARELAEQLASQIAPRTTEQIIEKLQLAHFFGIDRGWLTFAVPSDVYGGLHLPDGLPEIYGLKGGAARALLEATLALTHPECFSFLQSPPIRDVDLIRRFGTDRSQDETLLAQHNPEDFQYGAKVEEIRSIDGYLSCRDLTVNELAVFDTKGFISVLGLLDLIGRVLRPCKYRGGSLHRPRELSPLTVAKCLRLISSSTSTAVPWLLVGVPPDQEITPFALALQLRRCLQAGPEQARAFLRLCCACNISFDPDAELAPQNEHELVEQLFENLPEGEGFFPEEFHGLLRNI